jgi:hypothetical protein
VRGLVYDFLISLEKNYRKGKFFQGFFLSETLFEGLSGQKIGTIFCPKGGLGQVPYGFFIYPTLALWYRVLYVF